MNDKLWKRDSDMRGRVRGTRERCGYSCCKQPAVRLSACIPQPAVCHSAPFIHGHMQISAPGHLTVSLATQCTILKVYAYGLFRAQWCLSYSPICLVFLPAVQCPYHPDHSPSLVEHVLTAGSAGHGKSHLGWCLKASLQLVWPGLPW